MVHEFQQSGCLCAAKRTGSHSWRDSLPIDMILSAVSALVVAQSSPEIPEGLTNNPVYRDWFVIQEFRQLDGKWN